MALQYIALWYKTCMQQTTKRVFCQSGKKCDLPTAGIPYLHRRWYRQSHETTVKIYPWHHSRPVVWLSSLKHVTWNCWDMVQNTAAWSFGQIVRVVLDHPKQVACLRNKKKTSTEPWCHCQVIGKGGEMVQRLQSHLVGRRKNWRIGVVTSEVLSESTLWVAQFKITSIRTFLL